MYRLLVSPLLCLALSLSVGTQSRDTKAGFYELTFLQRTPDGSTKERKAIFFFKKEKKALKIIDIAFNHTFVGEVDDQQLSFGFKGSREFGWAKEGVLTLRGSIGDKQFSGRLQTGDPIGNIEVSALELASVWACSNHENPIHTAKSEEEIRELTARYQCERWHKLKASDMAP